MIVNPPFWMIVQHQPTVTPRSFSEDCWKRAKWSTVWSSAATMTRARAIGTAQSAIGERYLDPVGIAHASRLKSWNRMLFEPCEVIAGVGDENPRRFGHDDLLRLRH
jgi:hypothetical protein